MIRLRRTIHVRQLNVSGFTAALPGLLQCLRDLEFGDDGVVRTADGRALEGLRVTDGSHPRPHTSYSVVTRVEASVAGAADGRIVEPAEYADGWQRITISSGERVTTYAAYAVELVADDAGRFEVRAQEYGGGVEVLVTVPDPRWPKRVEFGLSGYLDGPRLVRSPVTGSATVALDELPRAQGSFRHRRVAGSFEVALVPDGDGWLAKVDVQIRLRGVLLLVAPFGWLMRRPMQKALDSFDPQQLAALQEWIDTTADPPKLLDALLAYIPETVPDEPTP